MRYLQSFLIEMSFGNNVTRFGEISPLWQNFSSHWQFFKGLFNIWQKVYLIFGKILQVIGNFLKVYLIFGKIVTLLWQLFCFWVTSFFVVKSQLLSELSSHLVTLFEKLTRFSSHNKNFCSLATLIHKEIRVTNTFVSYTHAYTCIHICLIHILWTCL